MGAPENDPRLNPGSLSRNNTHPLKGVSAVTAAQEAALSPSDFASAIESADSVPELPSRNYNEEMARPSESSLRKPSFSAAKSIGISNQSGLHIILPSSAARATAAGSLTDLTGCVVDMSVPTTVSGAGFPGLAIRNISGCLIVAGRVTGPVHITGVKNSVIVVSARQVRIHECTNVDIYLHCGSHPIIEDCTDMRFAPLPECYVRLPLLPSPTYSAFDSNPLPLLTVSILLTWVIPRQPTRRETATTSGTKSTTSSG